MKKSRANIIIFSAIVWCVAFVLLISPIAPPITYAQTQNTPPPAETLGSLPTCASFISFSFSGCIAVASYYLFFFIPSWILGIVGEIFNVVVSFSISGDIYNSQFVTEGWGIVRDLANIAFIFILLYVAISTILRIGADTKQILANVIIVAFLVNFSLFFTQVVVDTGNIAATYVYNLIITPAPTILTTSGQTPVKNISSALVAGFDPQYLLSGQTFKTDNETTTNIALAIIFLIGGIISIITIYALGWAALIFLVRVPILWLIMIGAPFAFIAWILSETKSFSQRWWHMLINQSFVAAIFLFFVYLIIVFVVNANFLEDALSLSNATQSLTAVIAQVVFKAGILLALILIAVKTAKNLSQNIAESTLGYLKTGYNKTIGGAKGVYGGSKKALRIGYATAGVLGGGRAATEKLKDPEWVARKSATVFGRAQIAALEGVATAGLGGGYKGRREAKERKYEARLATVEAIKGVAAREAIGTYWEERGGMLGSIAEKFKNKKADADKIAAAQVEVNVARARLTKQVNAGADDIALKPFKDALAEKEKILAGLQAAQRRREAASSGPK